MFKKWLNHEIPNKASLAGATTTATMVGIAANTTPSTVLGTMIIWTTADMAIYQYRNQAGETA